MRVRLLQRLATTHGLRRPGTVLDVADDEAQRLIARELAVALPCPNGDGVEAKPWRQRFGIETATIDTPERAVARRARRT